MSLDKSSKFSGFLGYFINKGNNIDTSSIKEIINQQIPSSFVSLKSLPLIVHGYNIGFITIFKKIF